MNNLIVKIKEALGDNLEYIKRNIIILAHNSFYVTLVWYYNLKTGKFNHSTDKEGHLDDPQFEAVDKSNNKLIRGRVIDYKGLIICIIYVDSSSLFKLPESILQDIKVKCEQVLKVSIDYILSDLGELLLEKRNFIKV